MEYNLELVNAVKDYLVEKKETLSVAESVTSGHLQASLSAATDASMFFQGGITAYNAGQKTRHLDVEPVYAMQDNCVSDRVARQMATAVTRMFISHYGIGITGYATVMPESGVNDLYAYAAIAYGDEILLVKKLSSGQKDSTDVQVDFTNQVMEALHALLKERR
jgi:nicotinamide-nucleotide amidase